MLSSGHLHLALNHLPILGLPLAAVTAVWGLATNNRGTLRAGLALVVVCAAATLVVMGTGNGASDDYDGADFIDSDGYAWMTEHGERAFQAAAASYAAGVVALAGFVVSFFSERFSRGFGWLAIAAAAVAAALSVWTADAGGKIRRPDFRDKPAASPSSPNHESP